MNTGAHRVARNTIVLLIGSGGRMLLSILLQVLVARWLGVVGLGKYTLLLAFLNIFQTVSELGLPALTIREAARERTATTQYLYATGSLQVVASVLAWGGMVGFAALLGYPPDTRLMLLIGGASLIPYALVSATSTVLQAQERMTPVVMIDLAGVLLTVAINIVLMWLGYGVLYLAIAIVITQGLAAIGSLVVLARLGQLRPVSWYPALMRALLRAAPEFFLLTLAVVAFSRMDVLALSRLRGETEVGVYTAAFLIVNAANLAFVSYGNAIYPRLAQLFQVDPGRFAQLGERVSKHALTLAVPVAVGGFMLAGDLIKLAYRSAQYEHSAAALQVVVWYAVPFALNTVLSRMLLSSNRQRMSVVVAGTKMVFGLVAYLALIPPLGVVGAALATVLSALLGTALNWFYVARHVARLRLWRLLFRPGLAALGMAAGLALLKANIFVELACGAAIYSGLIVALGGVGAEDLAVLRGLWEGRGFTGTR